MIKLTPRAQTAPRLAATLLTACVFVASTAQARVIKDGHGNIGYSTAAECDKAVLNGEAKFYESFTTKPPLLRAGEADSEVKLLGEVAGYERGACDRGVGHSNSRDGVSAKLIGTYVPYSPRMEVNAYSNADGKLVRLTMKQCDNNFSGPLPRPVKGAPIQAVASDCYADVLIPAKFENRTEEVVKVPETKRYETIPATYKTISEQVLVKPEIVKQIPVPATYKMVEEKVLVRPETVRREPIAPTFKIVEERILVKEASTAIKAIPATFKTVVKRTVSREASKRLIPYPAEFETTTERVQVSEAYKIWKRGRAWIGQAIDVRPLQGFKVGADGRVDGNEVAEGWSVADNRNLEDDVMCLVEIPAQFETITKQVLKTPAGVREEVIPEEYCQCKTTVVDQPARTETVEIPAQYRTIKRQVVDKPAGMREVPVEAQFETIKRRVIDTPASFREEVIPAEYETVTRKVVDVPASTREIVVPAQFETLTYRVKVSEPSTDRRQILCETNATKQKIREIQQALKAAGFDPGPIDGLLRAQAMDAVNAYQKANGLPVDGYLNIKTVEALGVSPN